MNTHFQVNPLMLIFLLTTHFFYAIFADQKVIRIFFNESIHPNTKNLGMAKIHTSVSQIFIQPIVACWEPVRGVILQHHRSQSRAKHTTWQER